MIINISDHTKQLGIIKKYFTRENSHLSIIVNMIMVKLTLPD
jgi:hypothetical protein